MGVRPTKKPLTITAALHGLLAAVGGDPASAVSAAHLEQRQIITRPAEGIRKLVLAGYVQSERRVDAEAGLNGVTATRLWYWRTPLGQTVLEALGDEPPRPTPPPPPPDDSGLLDPANTTRAAVTFRETMTAWGFATIAPYYAMPDRDTRDAFHADWTARLYRECALAGTPIPENAPYEKMITSRRARRD